MKFWSHFRNILNSHIKADVAVINYLYFHNVMEKSERVIIRNQEKREFGNDMLLYLIMMKVKYDSQTTSILINMMKQNRKYFGVLIPQMMELCKKFVLLRRVPIIH